MFKTVINLIIASYLINFAIPAFSSSTVANPKATATLAASCTINASNVNFGQVNLQAAQSGVTATSTMNVYCTKGSSYTISLAYGGIYGTGVASDYYTYQGQASGHYNYYIFNEYTPSGAYVGQIDTYYNPPQGTTYNATTKQYSAGNTVYAYGLLTGVANGDTIGYKITVPNNDSEVWNSGNYSYTGTGTGTNQALPIKATIQTGTHGSSYPSADSYMDVVTATITY